MSHPASHEPLRQTDQRHGRHGWLMIACCIPIAVIAIALVAARAVPVGFLLAAVGCAAMMALMMRGMSHGGRR